MKYDPLKSLSNLGDLSASMRTTDIFRNEADRLARQREELFSSLARPQWLRAFEDEEQRFKDLIKGPSVSDLAARAGVLAGPSSLGSAFGALSGTDALTAAGTSAFAQGFNTLQEQANRILGQSETAAYSLGQNDLLRDFQDQQKRAEELMRGITGSDAVLNAGLGFDAPGRSKISTSYDSVMAAVAGSLAGLTRPAATLDALGLGSQLAASHRFNDLRDQMAAYFQAPQSDFAGMDLMKGLADHLNFPSGSVFADVVADALGGVDAASFGTAALDFGARLYAKGPELRQARSAKDMRDTLGSVDANALLTQMARLTAAIEQSNASQGSRDKVDSWRFSMTVLLALVAIFVAILDLQKDERTSAAGVPNPTPLPSPRAQQRSAVRPALMATSRLAVRVGPHTTQRVALFVDEGQILPVLDTKAGWARVRYVAPESQGVSITGWVQLKYTSPMDVETLRMLVCELTAGESIEPHCAD